MPAAVITKDIFFRDQLLEVVLVESTAALDIYVPWYAISSYDKSQTDALFDVGAGNMDTFILPNGASYRQTYSYSLISVSKSGKPDKGSVNMDTGAGGNTAVAYFDGAVWNRYIDDTPL